MKEVTIQSSLSMTSKSGMLIRSIGRHTKTQRQCPNKMRSGLSITMTWWLQRVATANLSFNRLVVGEMYRALSSARDKAKWLNLLTLASKWAKSSRYRILWTLKKARKTSHAVIHTCRHIIRSLTWTSQPYPSLMTTPRWDQVREAAEVLASSLTCRPMISQLQDWLQKKRSFTETKTKASSSSILKSQIWLRVTTLSCFTRTSRWTQKATCFSHHQTKTPRQRIRIKDR